MSSLELLEHIAIFRKAYEAFRVTLPLCEFCENKALQMLTDESYKIYVCDKHSGTSSAWPKREDLPWADAERLLAK